MSDILTKILKELNHLSVFECVQFGSVYHNGRDGGGGGSTNLNWNRLESTHKP